MFDTEATMSISHFSFASSNTDSLQNERHDASFSPETKERIQGWQAASATQEVVAVIGDLYRACVTLFLNQLRGLKKSGDFSREEINGLKGIIQSLVLWGDAHGVPDGNLDISSHTTPELQVLILAPLMGISMLLQQRRYLNRFNNIWRISLTFTDLHHYAVELRQTDHLQYRHQYAALDESLRMARKVEMAGLDIDSELSIADLDDDETHQDEDSPSISVTIDDLKEYIKCLNDLNPLIESMGLHYHRDTTEGTFSVELKSIFNPFTDLIRMKFPNADASLVDRLGTANLDRYQGLLALREINRRDDDFLIRDYGESVASTKRSAFKDSAIGSSIRTSTNRSRSIRAPSIAPSIASTVNYSATKMPQIPREATLGEPFECTLCGSYVKAKRAGDYL